MSDPATEEATDEMQELLKEVEEALRANQVFHTPLVRRRLDGWDEYQTDAINRTSKLLNKLGVHLK